MIIRTFFMIILFKVFLFSCGGFWYDDGRFLFLEKRDYPFAKYEENLEFASTYNTIIDDYRKRAKEANLSLWQEQLHNKLSKEQIENIIYKNKQVYLIKNEEILRYLAFVKKQEIHVTSSFYNYYSKKEKENAIKPEFLIEEALENLEKVQSSYLKKRYFFLALRLAHYKNLKPLDIYNTYSYLLDDKNKTIIDDWILGIYAGALTKKGEIVKGTYEFSKLFSNDRINWHLAFYNFKYIKTQEQWDKLVNLSKNKDEIAKLYAIRGLSKNANIIHELKNIAKLDINSKYYELLLYKALLKSQSFFDIENDLYGKNEKIDYTNFIDYLKTVKKDDMYLVNLTLGFFSYYQNNIKQAKQYLSILKEKYSSSHEVQNLDYILFLNDIKKVNGDVEKKIYEKLNLLSNNSCTFKSVEKYTFYKLKTLYKNSNLMFKSYLMSQMDYFDERSLDLNRVSRIDELMNNKTNNSFENYIVLKLKNKNIQKTLENAKVYGLINNFKFKEALDTNSEVLNNKVTFNIFENSIKGNNRKGEKYQETIKEVLKQLLTLEKILKSNPTDTLANYKYATAIYNLSYFGNSAKLTTIYKSSYSFKSLELEKSRIQTSINHYKKALQTSNNSELKAKILYSLAKNELALYDLKNSKKESYYKNYDSYSFDRLYYFSVNDYKNYIVQGYGEFFKKLEKEYSSTNYYKDLIQECGNLRYFQKVMQKVSVDDSFKNMKKDERKFLKYLEKDIQVKSRKALKDYDLIYFLKLTNNIAINNKTVTLYNNIAYYLQEKRKSDEAIYLLNKVLEVYPKRVVAYYNLGDAYWDSYNRFKAKKAYKKYVELMKEANKENKIPQVVIQRLKG